MNTAAVCFGYIIHYFAGNVYSRFASALTDLTDEQQFAADVNTDGKVNSVDALAILRYSAGLSTEGSIAETVVYDA